MKKSKYLFISFIIIVTLFMVGCRPKKITITKIEVSPDSILVVEQENYDLANLSLKVTYSNDSTKTISVTKEMITKGYEKLNTYGSHDITITYEGLSIKATIVLKKPEKPVKTVKQIEIAEYSITSFEQGHVHLDEIFLDITYSDDSIDTICLSKDLIVEDISILDEIGKHNLTIQIDAVHTSIMVEIIEAVYVSNITLSDSAITTFIEDEFDISKVIIDVTYSNNYKEQMVVTSSMIKDGYVDPHVPNTYQLVVEYKEQEVVINITITESELKYYTFEKTIIDYEECYAITSYNGNKSIITIPSTYQDLPVKVIDKQAFYENKEIVKVTLPNTIVSIKEAAFYKCSSLKTIIIPSSVVDVEKYALSGIKSLYFEASVVDEAWYDTQHSYAHLNVNLDTIMVTSDSLFEYYINQDNELVLSNYYGLSSQVQVPNVIDDRSVEIIGGACFKGCNFIEKLTMPSSVKVIEKYGLAECESLVDLTLSNNLEILGEYALRGCILLPHISLPSTLKEIRANAFNMCSELQEMIIPNSVTYIGGYAFSWCVKLTKIYIPSSVKIVCGGACYSCSSATIYTPLSTIPSTWETGWNMSNRPIVYNVTE